MRKRAFPQNFHTRKSGEINFFAVTISKRDVLLHPLLFYVDCDSALGMESNFIPDKVITASSFLSSNPANYARLNTGKSNNNSWCASEVDKSQYLEVCIKTIHVYNYLLVLRSFVIDGEFPEGNFLFKISLKDTEV